MSRTAVQKLVVFSDYTYTLKTIIQAGQKNMAITSAHQRQVGDRSPKKSCGAAGANRSVLEIREALMAGVQELTPALGNAGACCAMGVWRGAPARRAERAQRLAFVGPPSLPKPARPASPLALTETERTLVLETLCSERFADTAPAAAHATLLDEGTYLASVRTMYRVLTAKLSSAERRNQRNHPVYAKPELLALAPNQVWSWDSVP